MYFQNFLLDLLSNFFDFYTMELFTLTFFHYTHVHQKTYYRYLFLGINLIISAIPHIPYIWPISITLSFIYFFLVSSFRFKDSILFCIKYELITNILYFITGLLCALANFNAYGIGQDLDNIFFDYQTLIGIILTYILLNLYVNTRRLHSLHIKTVYSMTFSLLSVGIVFLMLFFNNMLSKYDELTNLLPWLYVAIVSILVLSLNSYRKIIETLEEQMKQRILVEKYEMELSYFTNIQDSLDTLSRIRHDFKNHLIVLDSYASQNRISDLRNYINQVHSKLTDTKIISTPNDLISSILNTKNAACQTRGITFLTDCNFEHIYISDFAIITILGNILDNAITATSQIPNGKVELTLFQIDNYLEISCRNNHNGNIIEKNGFFSSTKEDNYNLHGLGISNVRDCVNNLHGTTEISYDATNFTVDILIPNRSDR